MPSPHPSHTQSITPRRSSTQHQSQSTHDTPHPVPTMYAPRPVPTLPPRDPYIRSSTSQSKAHHDTDEAREVSKRYVRDVIVDQSMPRILERSDGSQEESPTKAPTRRGSLLVAGIRLKDLEKERNKEHNGGRAARDLAGQHPDRANENRGARRDEGDRAVPAHHRSTAPPIRAENNNHQNRTRTQVDQSQSDFVNGKERIEGRMSKPLPDKPRLRPPPSPPTFSKPDTCLPTPRMDRHERLDIEEDLTCPICMSVMYVFTRSRPNIIF